MKYTGRIQCDFKVKMANYLKEAFIRRNSFIDKVICICIW